MATKRLLRSEAGSVTARVDEELAAFREQLGSGRPKAAVEAFFAKARRG